MIDDDVTIDVLAWQGAACVGDVVDAGERARGLIGLRVLAGTADACGECEVCRAGGATVCTLAKPRALGKRTTAMARWLVPLQDGIELPVPGAAAVGGDITLAYTATPTRASPPARSPRRDVTVPRFLVEPPR